MPDDTTLLEDLEECLRLITSLRNGGLSGWQRLTLDEIDIRQRRVFLALWARQCEVKHDPT